MSHGLNINFKQGAKERICT